jgi:hydrogenase maturation factor HypF (carbamoyltransferase family)
MKQKKGADIINLENQRILDEENYTTDYALQTERERIRYEAELAAANKSGADTTLITAKHALAKEKIEENLQASKVAALGASLGIVSDILGRNQQLVKQQHLHVLLLILIKVLQLVLSLVSSIYQQ